MQRPLGFFETYSKAGYDLLARDGIVITMATLEGQLEVAQLSQALHLLQERHPLLQACLAQDDQDRSVMDTGPYEALGKQERHSCLPLKILEREGDLSAKTAFREESALPIEAWSRYLWRLVWVRGTDRHELILISRHEITDATSTTHMLRDLLVINDLLARGQKQHPLFEKLPLLDSVERLLPESFRIGENSTTAPPQETAIWPYEGFAEPQARTGVYEFSAIGPELLAKLRQKCKSLGLTMNSALSAAFFLAEFRKFQNPAIETSVCYRTAISLRNRCTPTVGNEHLGTFAMTVATTFENIQHKSFWAFAAEVGQVLGAEIQAMESNGFLPESFQKEDVFQATRDAYALTSSRHLFADGPWISNLGLLAFDEVFGSVKLTGMYFGTRQVAGDAGAVLSIITLHGHMFSCLTTASPLMSAETCRGILDDFEALLIAAAE